MILLPSLRNFGFKNETQSINIQKEIIKRKGLIEGILYRIALKKVELKIGKDIKKSKKGSFVKFSVKKLDNNEFSLDKITCVKLRDKDLYISSYLIELCKNGYGISPESKDIINMLYELKIITYSHIYNAMEIFVLSVIENLKNVLIFNNEIKLIMGAYMLEEIKSGTIKKEDLFEKSDEILEKLEEENINDLEGLIHYFLREYLNIN